MQIKLFKPFSFALIIFLMLFNVQLQADTQDELKKQFGAINNGQLKIGQNEISALEILKSFYHKNNYQLTWKDQSMIETLRRTIEAAEDLGLSPEDYHLAAIQNRIDGRLNKTDEQQAQLDIILSDSLVRLVYHLTYGKVVPGRLDPNWNFSRVFLTTDPVGTLHDILQSAGNLKKFLDERLQQGPFYQKLVKALAKYRQIKQNGGWSTIPAGELIKPGMSDRRIPLIKSRLQASGDLKAETIDQAKLEYGTELEMAVKSFQQRHNLEMDGVIGEGTLQQMNVSVTQRIEQIRANLERLRWVRHNIGDEFVLVNIAGYKVYYVRDNQIIWESRVQVGKEYRQTPVFRDEIQYLAFNPTWTVPPTILSKDILPKLKKDPGYLQKKNMNVIDSKGNIIDASTINWSTMTANKFPYMIRQEPGPENALGRVKIMFPNKHLVYLHDTPSKSQFSRNERAFSSGCIRVEAPFELAELLLNDSSQWNQQRFQTILASGELQNVNLTKKIPVLLLYFTVQTDNGHVIFFNDIYNRDQPIIDALSKPFHLELPEEKK